MLSRRCASRMWRKFPVAMGERLPFQPRPADFDSRRKHARDCSSVLSLDQEEHRHPTPALSAEPKPRRKLSGNYFNLDHFPTADSRRKAVLHVRCLKDSLENRTGASRADRKHNISSELSELSGWQVADSTRDFTAGRYKRTGHCMHFHPYRIKAISTGSHTPKAIIV
jgi:hypothetical protein